MRILLMALMFTGFAAQAEEKTCVVNGMHCQGCTEMVEGKLCDETKFSKCVVKITNAEKELGEVHLVTKDPKAKVDQKAVEAVIKDSGYELKSCKVGKKA